MSASNDKKKEKKCVFKIPKFLKNIKKEKRARSSGLFCARNINPPETFDSHKIMNPSVPNPPETVDSLHKYETETGQAQKFLDCVRATVLFYLADESALEFDDEAALNLIFFYDNLDKGTFDEHKDDWVLVYKQEVKKYETSGLFCARNINPPETFDSHKIMNPSVPNPPETVDSLHKYETETGQAQKFLDCVRATVLFYLADESALEFDDEAALNLIFFYDNLDKGTFDEHKDDWVLVYKQEVKKYETSEYTSKELEDLEQEMPARTVSARRVNQEHMVRIQVRRLRTTNSVHQKRPSLIMSVTHLEEKFSVNANGYGYPARVFYASSTFEYIVAMNQNLEKRKNLYKSKGFHKPEDLSRNRQNQQIEICRQNRFHFKTLAWTLNNETVEKEDNEISVDEEISKMGSSYEIFFTLKIHLFLKG
ncbi:hypothetical protein Glove_43g36 [Diversispora epigaea]|uniref:Uncharacterized protein n=1 Tax=Diversispora epigaea TaxID=1348612 RepID=A0A397JEX3_9GLOM|nr:hypothetical protein Glove_43g36 [Diversispora epigaea]